MMMLLLLLLISVLQNRMRSVGSRKDYLLCQREGRLRHLRFETAVNACRLLADICVHFCQDGYEVTAPAGKIKK